MVYQDQLTHSESLQSVAAQIKHSLDQDSAVPLNDVHLETFADSSSLALSSLPRVHLEGLCACHNLCSLTFLYSWAPTSLLVKWLTARGHELIADDFLLLTEGDLENLTSHEVIDACLRRGILPRGVYGALVLQSGEEEEDGDEEENTDTTEEDIVKLMQSNWDIDMLRERLREWVGVVSRVDSSSLENNVSLYVHASALGLFVRK